MLFELETDPKDAVVALRFRAEEEGMGPDIAAFAEGLVKGVTDHQAELDILIAGASRNWKLEQMAKVDRIILRIAAYELTVARNVPPRAAINESIELAKTFSGEEAGRFVNGVLGKIAAAGSPS